MNLYEADDKLQSLDVSNAEFRVLSIVKHYVNKKHWKPAAIPESAFEWAMSKPTFLTARKHLVELGYLAVTPGRWKTDSPVYDLGPVLKIGNNAKKEDKMRDKKAIRELVIEIDQQYPDFSELCSLYSWDKAIEVLKAGHPELQLLDWAVDSIGDPVNRKQAHEMFIKLHVKKGGQPVGTVKLGEPDGPWTPFYLFVDMWLLSYPKKAIKASVKAAVREFIRDKDQWTPAQVKDLQDKIEAHTRAYAASFADDIKYMVSPANYFASEKWTEKVPVKYDKTDVNYKTAGAPARPNMPSITTIKAN